MMSERQEILAGGIAAGMIVGLFFLLSKFGDRLTEILHNAVR